MDIKLFTKVSFTNAFRDFIKSQQYEKYVFIIISKSETIFNGKRFTHLYNQSNGEPDFIDQEGNKYEAKLIFDKMQGKLLGEQKNDIDKWFVSLQEEVSEFSETVIRKRNTELIKETKLYNILVERLSSVGEDENVLFFIPYPIVNDVRGSIFLQFATDYIQAVHNKMVEEKLIGDRMIYFIYPSMDASVYVLRDGNYHREYIECKELDPLIVYKTDLKV